MKLLHHLFFAQLIVLPLYAFASANDTINVLWADQQAAIDGIRVSYEGTRHRNQGMDVEQIEKASQYKKWAKKGRLPFETTVEDVQKWYDKIAHPHQHAFKYVFVSDGTNIKKTVETGKITAYPWPTVQEYSTFDQLNFHRFHANETVGLGDSFSTYSKFKYNLYFNPLLITYPLHYVQNPDALEAQMLEDGKILVRSTQPIGLVESFQAILNPNKGGIAEKTLLKIAIPASGEQSVEELMDNNRFSWVYLAENFDIQQKNGTYFPARHVVARTGQCNSGENCGSMPKHPKFDIRQISTNEKDFPYDYKWEAQVDELTWNPNLSQDTFWLSVPEGYQYKDTRDALMDPLKTQRKAGAPVTQEDLADVKGEGPYQFPKNL